MPPSRHGILCADTQENGKDKEKRDQSGGETAGPMNMNATILLQSTHVPLNCARLFWDG